MKTGNMIWILLFTILSIINSVGAMVCDIKVEKYHFQEMSAIYLVGLGVIYTIKCVEDKRK
jgi:hypothetical protein